MKKIESLKQIPIYSHYDFDKPLPYLTKQMINHNFPLNWQTQALQQRLAEGDVEWLSTSGTTSERMQIMRPKRWRSEQIARSYQYHHLLQNLWQQKAKRAVLSTVVCSQMLCFKKAQTIDSRWLDRSLYLNMHHNPHDWQKQDIERMLAELASIGKYILDADPFYLAIFIKKMKQYALTDKLITPQCITLSYELATSNTYHFLQQFFQCPIINIYGSSELGYLLMSNDSGVMINCSEQTEYEYRQIEHSDNLYELIVSSFKNPYMPLLRYQTGDVIELDKQQSVVKRVMGRASSYITLASEQQLYQQNFDDMVSLTCKQIFYYQLKKINDQQYLMLYSTFDEQPLEDGQLTSLSTKLDQQWGLSIRYSLQNNIQPQHSGKFSWLSQDE